MSEPIPESIPTSADPRSRRPLKRARPANNTPSGQAASAQSHAVSALFANPDRPVHIPMPANNDKRGGLAPPPEIVANVQGSSAGAGSGEFHVYKASRRREYERVRMMEEEKEREEKDTAFEKKKEELSRRDEEAARRRREKRLKRRGKGGAKENANAKGSAAIPSGKTTLGAAGRVLWHDERDDDKSSGHADGQDVPIAAEEVGIVIHDDD